MVLDAEFFLSVTAIIVMFEFNDHYKLNFFVKILVDFAILLAAFCLIELGKLIFGW